MPTSTVEDYLKHIFMEQQRTSGTLVSNGRVAALLGVTPGTATAMVKTLADSGLVQYEPRSGVAVTERGRKLAVHVLRRHRLIELFLVKHLGLDWSEVHEEADVLEHAVSDKVLERIDDLLGSPTVDPHGDLIPNAQGQFIQRAVTSLANCEVGQRVQLARVTDEDAQFLRFAESKGLLPGRMLTVTDVDAMGEAISLTPDEAEPLVIGLGAAQRLLVTPIDE